MTATPANEDHCLRDSEVALTNAISAILEIIIAKGIEATPDAEWRGGGFGSMLLKKSFVIIGES